MTELKVGILGMQGDVRRHREILQCLDVEPTLVRTRAELEEPDCLIIPGGESTAISKLLHKSDLLADLEHRVADGMPVWGTCAGMILLSTSLAGGRSDQINLSAIDLSIRRNGYGPQIASFEAPLDIPALGAEPFTGVFIRSPVVESCGPQVEVLATHGDDPVLCRQGHVWASAFHPELTDDTRLHQHFLQSAQSASAPQSAQSAQEAA